MIPYLTGYSDKISVRPGGQIGFMVSTTEPDYDVDLVRLSRKHDGDKFVVIERTVLENYLIRQPGRVQRSFPGSCAVIPNIGTHLSSLPFLEASFWMAPTKAKDERQVLASTFSESRVGWEVALTGAGHIEFVCSNPRGTTSASLAIDDHIGTWHHVSCGYDRAESTVWISIETPRLDRKRSRSVDATPGDMAGSSTSLAVAARIVGTSGEQLPTAFHYNGKLEDLRLTGRLGGNSEAVQERVVADWDFAADIDTDRLTDRGPGEWHGFLVNRPTRAVTGHAWTGDVLDHRFAPGQYGAIHFHEDDVARLCWLRDFSFTVPEDLSSGVYAMRCRASSLTDHIPFVVTGSVAERAAVCVVLPTFTYLAYANSRVALDGEFIASGVVGRRPGDYREGPLLTEHPEWGGSLYDTHADGSGVVYASRLRPLLTMRPGYDHWITRGPRNFSADLCLIDWFDRLEVPVDLLTDEDVHLGGRQVLAPYSVVVTGSHPEYASSAMLDAFEGTVAGGGRLMYLGGNGFYWVTSVDRDSPDLLEVRRGAAGTRPWTSAPGESHHATTGEPGGLWRGRGRPPERLVGVGFAAQGWDDYAGWYERTEASFERAYEWVFEGVDCGRFGEFGVMGGAAGDEIDHHVSPPDGATGVVLASSTGHSEYYCLAVEELTQTSPDVVAPKNDRVRSDVFLADFETGGAVFSVGSINWVTSMAWNLCRNDVAKITENVLRRFMSDWEPMKRCY